MSEPQWDGLPLTPGVFSGIRVIDAGTVLAAPGAGSLLADFGAEVIKVEQPNVGDPLRRFPPHVAGADDVEQSLVNKVTNRGKLTVGLDLNDARGRDVFRRLAATADAVILNYRLPTLRRWQLDYPDLKAVKDDLVVLHITGYGRTGPYAERPGFARVAEAFVGLTYMTGFPDRRPLPAGYAVADAIGAIFGAYSLSIALYHKRCTGQGQLIDLALFESIMRLMDGLYISYDQAGTVPERSGSTHPGIAPHDIYESGDGVWMSVPASTQNMFVRLCSALERPDVALDPRFATNGDRVRHRAELDAVLVPALQALTADEFLTRANRIGIAATRINSVANFVDDEHVHDRESLVRVPDPQLKRDVLMQNVVPRLSESPGAIRWPGREVGQDNEYVYRQLLGMSATELDDLSADGVV